MNAIQLQPDAQPPNALFLSMWSPPATQLTCLICQYGWTGRRWYALATSDLYRMRGESGAWWCMESRNSPKCCRLSRGYPMMSSLRILLLREYFLALWSVTICKSIECGFGMVKIGIQHMPGSNLSPKYSEKRPMKTSWSLCFLKKATSSGSSGSGKEKLMVSGKSPIWVLAQGQKPSRTPRQTDLTKGWFGCDLRSPLKCSTKIGVTISKRCGFSLIVLVTTGFANSESGMVGSGDAVSVQSAEEWEKCSLLS